MTADHKQQRSAPGLLSLTSRNVSVMSLQQLGGVYGFLPKGRQGCECRTGSRESVSSDLAAMAGALMCACPHAACPQQASPLLVAGWSEEEAAAFEAGLDAHGRRFDLVHVHMLPHRSERELVSFFYDVWKTRSTPRARAWHARKKEVRTSVLCRKCRAGQVSAASGTACHLVRLPLAAGLKPGTHALRRCAARSV